LAKAFLGRLETNGEEFLRQVVTGGETWIQYVNPETREQAMRWLHTHCAPNKPKKFKQTFSDRKTMVTVFWDSEGVLLTEFMEPGTTKNAAVHCETLRKLRRAIQNKRQGMLTKGVALLHDSARPHHTAACTKTLIEEFNWDILDHPPYSPDLAPSDNHLFPSMKSFIASQRFGSSAELMNGVNQWVNSLAAPFFKEGIQKLVPYYKKCIETNGDYIRKII